jgi:hypothetical protein
LGPLQEELVRLIGDLATLQSKVNREAYELEEKRTALIALGVEEIAKS